MITTGTPSNSATKTEIVDLANGLSCSDMAEFPVLLGGGVGANLGGTPVVCSGWSWGYSDKCYRLTATTTATTTKNTTTTTSKKFYNQF